jgi:serine/threonine protein kinase/signal recognition particle receptor subunit beta/Flp pilus assembly protein TadD
MARIDFPTRTLTCKIVYYGPGLAGKTTNLEVLYDRAPAAQRGELTAIATSGDRTIFFDFLPLELGKVGGLRVSLQLYTVPGQSYYAATRRLVLSGADGVVFVADSQAGYVDRNRASLAELREQLEAQGAPDVPIVFQWNKRDMKLTEPVPKLAKALNPGGLPAFSAVATRGEGVTETLRALTRLVLDRCRDEYERGEAAEFAPRSSEGGSPPGTRTSDRIRRLLPEPDLPPLGLTTRTTDPAPPSPAQEGFSAEETVPPEEASPRAREVDSTEEWDGEPIPQIPREHDVGEVVGGCVIVAKLGEGGMGTAYLARLRSNPEQTVVVKTLKAGRQMTEGRVRRFFREARSAARLDHENVVKVEEVGTDERGLHYMIMQHVQGQNLKQHVLERGPLGPFEAARILLEVAKGLVASHASGVIHRDVKPDNVVLGADGDVKLIDFGLARDLHLEEEKVRPGGVVGTVMYMAPERFSGAQADARGDIFSLGLTYYYLITGQLPFQGRRANEVMACQARLRPPEAFVPDLSPRIRPFMEHLLARNPDDRPQTAAELVVVIESLWDRNAKPLPRRPGRFWLWDDGPSSEELALRWAVPSESKHKPAAPPEPPADLPPPSGRHRRGSGRLEAAAPTNARYSHEVLSALDAWDTLPEEDVRSSEEIARLIDQAWDGQEQGWGEHVMLEDSSDAEQPIPFETKGLLGTGWQQDLKQALASIERAPVAAHQRSRLSRDPGQAVVNAILRRGPAAGGTRKIKRPQLDQAIKSLTRSVKKNRDHPQPYTKRGIARARPGDLEGAIRDYTRALRLDKGYLPALANRASAHFHLGRYAQVEADCTRALRRAPRLAKAWLFRGIARAVRGKPGAKDDMLKFLQLSPYSPYVRYIKRLLQEVEE